ncbi:MAG: IS30 family transposase, partial [Lachnospiraceae bacterium]|nr:IS30 family transposase [Lachnospiraceae bacterium]
MSGIHLTDDNRLTIEHSLNSSMSIKTIASLIGKSTSTISREIKKHAVTSNKSAYGKIANRCIDRNSCTKQYLCSSNHCRYNLCRYCNKCNSICTDFQEDICSKLSMPPYVCNGCSDENTCTLRKKYYKHRTAHKQYVQTLSEARSGINISEDEIVALDFMISPLIKNGQSVHHIIANNPDLFNLCEKTIYKYIDMGLCTAKNIDMPRVVRFKPRKMKSSEHKIDKKCRINRTYDDFLEFKQNHPDTAIVETDTVIGRIGGKTLLTIHFKICDFMLAFLLERNTSQAVIDVYNNIYNKVGKDTFKRLFPVLLTDNGSEFSNPLKIEKTDDNKNRTMLFYCNPSSPYQKPNVELNHEFIRRILPKGTSFDSLTQQDI